MRAHMHTMSKLAPQHVCRGLHIAHVAKLMLAYLWYYIYTLCIVGGLILGDPNGQFIHIDHPTVKPSDIRGVEVLSKAAPKCALALLDVLFSKECLARSLATKKEDKDLLDPDIIEGIRCKIKLHNIVMLLILFILSLSMQCTSTTNTPAPHLKRRERWGGREGIIKKINDKCRNIKNRSRGH